MRAYDGVLFDWSGTLVHDPDPAMRVRWALGCLSRSDDDRTVSQLLGALDQAALRSEVIEATNGYDRDADLHRAGEMLLFQTAGLDPELADQLYSFDTHPDNRPLFTDVLEVLTTLRDAGVRFAVVSNIHFDIRPLLALHGVAGLVEGYALSYEHGVEKPDPRLFAVGLDQIGTVPERTLMVGDVATADGGASELGVTTIILPRVHAQPDRPRLATVKRLVLGTT